MPTIPYGFNEHHMDFPGTIAVDGETFIRYVTDVTVSVARHGFQKILIVNGHGSYLHLAPEDVRRDQIAADLEGMPPSDFMYLDLLEGAPVRLMEWWSTFSRTGVLGDPTKATAEKGQLLWEAEQERMIQLIREFRARPLRPRVDHHLG